MKGNKWRAFVLDLRFILWDILGVITLGIVSVLWVDPYRQLTDAALYNALKTEGSVLGDDNMKKKTRGTVTLVCGIICVLSAAALIVVRLGFGNDFEGRISIPMNLVWIALGIYFCYLGIKMRKKDN